MIISHNLPDGQFVINVADPNHSYEQFFVEVERGNINVFEHNLKTGKGKAVAQPVEIRALYQIKYEEDKNILMTMVKSPYAIMIGVGVVLFLGFNLMPQDYLEENLKEANKQMSDFKRMYAK